MDKKRIVRYREKLEQIDEFLNYLKEWEVIRKWYQKNL